LGGMNRFREGKGSLRTVDLGGEKRLKDNEREKGKVAEFVCKKGGVAILSVGGEKSFSGLPA